MPDRDQNTVFAINKLKYAHGVLLGHIMNLNKDLNRLRNELNQKNTVIDKLEKDNFNYLESQENLTEQLKTLESKFDAFVEEVKAENVRRALEEEEVEYTEEEVTVEETESDEEVEVEASAN